MTSLDSWASAVFLHPRREDSCLLKCPNAKVFQQQLYCHYLQLPHESYPMNWIFARFSSLQILHERARTKFTYFPAPPGHFGMGITQPGVRIFWSKHRALRLFHVNVFLKKLFQGMLNSRDEFCLFAWDFFLRCAAWLLKHLVSATIAKSGVLH